MSARFLRRLWLSLAATLLCGAAQAEPYLAVQQGLQCVACHVNPTGGGLRNAFGAAFSQTALPAYMLPGDKPVWYGKATDWLRLGGDLRASTARSEVPSQPSTSTQGLDQARLYVDAELLADRLGIYLDEQVRPGKPVRQEAYVRLSTPDQRWYAKAGQFYLPFGWRLQDNTAFVRGVSGISMTTPDKGLELGLQTAEWSLQLVRSNGPGNVAPTTGHQTTAQGVWLQDWGRVGLALAHTQSSAGNRMATGLFGGFRTGDLAWLGELDLVGDSSFAGGRRRQLAGLAEVNWGFSKGQNLKFTSELFDPDRQVANDHKVRHSLVYELTPIPFVQLRAGYRRNGGIPQSNFDNRRSMFLELHTFL